MRIKKLWPVTTVILIAIISCKNSGTTDSNASEVDLIRLSADEYYDKVYASWLGQIIGNIYGLPHENAYVDDPRPDSLSIIKYRGWPLQQMIDINGAFSDDDTDIEYMYLLQMQQHGIEPSYAQLKKAWTYHIRDRVWLANRAALTAMNYGATPPITGAKKYNPHWFQIDPQLVNEIWAVTAPGMINYASNKSAWAARITNDSWGIEPTIHYAAMYAAAYFEKDIDRLIDIGNSALPEHSRFVETVAEIRKIYNRFPNPKDWRSARAALSEKYYINEPTATKTMWNANLNGACSILALLYGKGDFTNTLDMSCALGFDADNQAATMAGLLGVVHGTKGLPEEFLFPIDSLAWEKPFNDVYKNVSRHDLPDTKITDMATLSVAQGEKIIVANGGKILEEDGQKVYLINKNATYVPPLEISQLPNLIFEQGKLMEFQIIATIPNDQLDWQIDLDSLPDGVTFEQGKLSGVPKNAGYYELHVTALGKNKKKSARIAFTIFNKNLAPSAKEIIASQIKTNTERRDKMWITVGRNLFSDEVTIINDGKWSGDGSVFYSVGDSKLPHNDFYGYLWEDTKDIGNIAFRTGPMEENGSWFQSLNVEYLDESGTWKSVNALNIFPKFDTTNLVLNKAHYINYHLQFSPVKTKGIRIIGEAGGGEHWMEASKDIYYTSITELAVYPPLSQ